MVVRLMLQDQATLHLSLGMLSGFMVCVWLILVSFWTCIKDSGLQMARFWFFWKRMEDSGAELRKLCSLNGHAVDITRSGYTTYDFQHALRSHGLCVLFLVFGNVSRILVFKWHVFGCFGNVSKIRVPNCGNYAPSMVMLMISQDQATLHMNLSVPW